VITPSEIAACDRAALHLQQLTKVCGQFTISDESMAWWDAWYRKNHSQVSSSPPNLKSWYGTKAARLMELAMLTALSEGFDLVLHPQHFQVPMEYLTQLELDLPKIFGGVGRNELAMIAQKILDYIDAVGRSSGDPVSKTTIRKMFYNELKPPSDYNDVITFLKETKQLDSCTLQVGSAWDELFATPECLTRWRVKHGHAATSPPAASTPTA
jgi:hypothetical protein